MILLRPPVRQLEETVWIGPHTCAVPVNSSSWIAGAEERGDKHIRQYKAQGEHGFPSAKLEMIRESLEAEFLFNERLKKH